MDRLEHIKRVMTQLGSAAGTQLDTRACASHFVAQLGRDPDTTTVALLELSRITLQSVVPVERTHEALRIATLIEGMRLLLDAHANPMHHLDGLLEGHAEWVRSLLWEIAAQWDDRHWADPDGENPLHVLGRGGCDVLRIHEGQWAWLPCPATWGRQARRGDGMTPLHVVWSNEGLAGKVMEWATHAAMSWMAYEVLEEAIVYTRWLLDSQHASWDDTSAQGERAGATLLRAWDGGVGHWMPNVGGVEWIEGALEQQRRVELARERREQLIALAQSARG